MTLGEIIRKKRLEEKIPLRTLAEKTKLSPTYISLLERNLLTSPVSEDSLKKICIILRLDFYDLMPLTLKAPSIIKEAYLKNPEALLNSAFDILST